MASFKKVQEMLCLCLIEEIIDEEEFVLLYEAYRASNLPFPHSAYEKFSLANKDPAECKADFRVEKRDIPLLPDALRVAPVFQCRNGTICDEVEGLVYNSEEVCFGFIDGTVPPISRPDANQRIVYN